VLETQSAPATLILWAARTSVNRMGVAVAVRLGKEARPPLIASQRTRRFARLAQIAFDSAQARLSLRNKRLLRMTIKGVPFDLVTAITRRSKIVFHHCEDTL